jgi:ethanolamine utilization protein EutN
MKIGKVTGHVNATAKDPKLVGLKTLIADIVDSEGVVLSSAMVVVDTCGAGVGDTVLIAIGSAARIPSAVTGAPVDASIVAIVEKIYNSNQINNKKKEK